MQGPQGFPAFNASWDVMGGTEQAAKVLHTIQELWLGKERDLVIVPDLFADRKVRRRWLAPGGRAERRLAACRNTFGGGARTCRCSWMLTAAPSAALLLLFPLRAEGRGV